MPAGSSDACEMMDSFGGLMQTVCAVTGFLPQSVDRPRQSVGKAWHVVGVIL